MSIKRKLIVSAAAVCLIAAGALWYYRETRPFRFRTGRSLRELSGIGASLSEQEIAAVSNMLMQYYVENETTAGFVHYSAPEDLQGLYALYQFARVFDAPELQEDLQHQLSQIRLPAPDTMDIVNLVYYAELGSGCNASDYDESRTLRAFSRFYDQNNHLFFLVDENDDMHKKIALTAFCAEHIPALKERRLFSLQEGAEKAMQGYRFDTNPSLAFFNAGGDILHLYQVLNLDCTETVRQQVPERTVLHAVSRRNQDAEIRSELTKRLAAGSPDRREASMTKSRRPRGSESVFLRGRMKSRMMTL